MYLFTVVSFLMVLMIRYLAPVIVWLIVVLAALGSLGESPFQTLKHSNTI